MVIRISSIYLPNHSLKVVIKFLIFKIKKKKSENTKIEFSPLINSKRFKRNVIEMFDNKNRNIF